VKIAVYTIALNEEQFVERWYQSAKQADYLLIADTGSTDGTISKARALGINVISINVKPWRFDVARNASLAALPADIDYCVALDMDEVLVAGWREHLEKATATRPRYQYTWSWNADGSPGLQYGGDKIHTRHGYYWKHPVHEVLNNYGMDETQEWVGLNIEHHPDDSKSRGQYFPLLELAVAEDPYGDRNLYYLGREYYFYNMHDKAVEMFSRYLEVGKWAPERAAALRYMAKCQPDKAEEYLNKALLEGDRRETLVDLAMYYYGLSEWAQCKEYAVRAIRITDKPLDYLCEVFAWSEVPYDLIAVSEFNLGNHKAALIYGEIAAEMNKSDERLQRNLRFYKEKLNANT